MNRNARNDTLGNGRTGKVRTPCAPPIARSENATLGSSGKQNRRIVRRDFNCGNGGTIQKRRYGFPGLAMNIGAP